MRASKSFMTMIMLILLAVSPAAMAGHAGGNGGDYIRATFLRMGGAVMSYLRETQEGQDLVRVNALDLVALDGALSIDIVEVVDGLLLDNGGSAVDAIGVPGKIRLSSLRWVDHLAADRDVYFLVLHEMLRAIAVNDDNYVISKAINPFPQGRRIITRINSLFPLLGGAALTDIFDPSAIQLAGDGCPRGLAGTFIDFDSERNDLTLTFNRYDIHLGAGDPSSGRKACSIVIPYKSRPGTRLKIMQMDLSAKAELAAGAQAAISADVAIGSNLGQPKTASIVATVPEQGRLLVRTGGVFETGCDGQAGIISVHSATSARITGVEASMLSADRLTLSFVVESCSAPSAMRW